ncbi:MAG: FkbM family methyltransferase [Halofilum sp. (in: g-proteobacteria)]
MDEDALQPEPNVPGELQALPTEVQRARSAVVDEYMTHAAGVLHLGAHTGQEREQYAQMDLPVVWVEAHPIIHRRLQANIAAYPNQWALCGLLADRDGRQVDFGRSANVGGESSSIFGFGVHAHAMWPDQELHMIERVTLPTVTLDSLLQAHGVRAADHDFWVLDIQGAELLALRGARQSLRACRALVIEISTVEVYRGGALWPEVRDFLEFEGFSPVWQPARAHDDILFVPTRSAEARPARQPAD